MKRRILLAIVCCLLLCGCTKVREAEDAIDALPLVSPYSDQVISNVQVLLDELSEKELSRVENLQKFLEYQAEYQRIRDLLETCKTAINGLDENITLESGSKIEAARNAYDALVADELTEYVEELYPALEKAENSYAELNEILKNAKDAVKNIGTVSLKKRDAIDRAKTALAKAKNKGLEEYLKEEIALYEKSKEEFREIDTADLYEQVIRYLNEGNYVNASSALNKIKSNYPSHKRLQEAETAAGQLMLDLLQSKIKSKSYLETEKLIQACNRYFSNILKDNTEFQKLCEEQSKCVEKLRPQNGKILKNTINGGWCQLKVVARKDKDALIKVECLYISEDFTTGEMLFYVRKGESATVSLADGLYRISYKNGTTWYGLEDQFGTTGDFVGFSNGLLGEFVSFTTEYSGNEVRYSVVTATIPEK